MEEVQEQSDQPPPSVTIDGVNEDCHAWLLQCTHKALQCVQKKDSELSLSLVGEQRCVPPPKKKSTKSVCNVQGLKDSFANTARLARLHSCKVPSIHFL